MNPGFAIASEAWQSMYSGCLPRWIATAFGLSMNERNGVLVVGGSLRGA